MLDFSKLLSKKRTGMALSPHPLEREHDKFELNSDDETAVRITASQLDSTLLAQFTLMSALLGEMNEKLEIAVNHLRSISGIETDKGDKF